MAEKLSPKQLAFIREYLLCRNGVEAARKAGYKGTDNTLAVVAAENLRKPNIMAVIKANEKKVEQKFEITQEKIVEELAAIAFGHMGKIATWGEEEMKAIPKDQMSEADMKFVESVEKLVIGDDVEKVVVKGMTYQKVKALELLGKHIGMWRPKNETGHGDREVARRNAIARIREHLRKRTK